MMIRNKTTKIIISIMFIFSLSALGCNKEKYTFHSDANKFDELFQGAIKYDIRETTLCEEGHIPSFLCVGDTSKEQLIENITILVRDKKRIIIIIGDDDDVKTIFLELAKKGYKNLYSFTGGYESYVLAKGDDFVPEVGCDC